MIAGDDQDGSNAFQGLGERQGPLELTVPGPLGQVTREDDRVGFDIGDETFEDCDLLQVDIPAKVNIGELREGDRGHHTARIR
jgi:hypothetical protein